MDYFEMCDEVKAQLRQRRSKAEPTSRVLMSQRVYDSVMSSRGEFLNRLRLPDGPLTHVMGLRVILCPDADLYVPSDRVPA